MCRAFPRLTVLSENWTIVLRVNKSRIEIDWIRLYSTGTRIFAPAGNPQLACDIPASLHEANINAN